MQSMKKKNKKQSHSSIKLPKLENRLASPGLPKNKIKYRDGSLQLIHAKPFQSNQRILFEKNQLSRYEKKKSKSRAEPIRMKTEEVNQEIDHRLNVENSLSFEDLDHTLKNFKKNIEQNKQKIHNRIAWKKQGNKSSLASIQTAEQSMAKKKSLIRNEFYQDIRIFEKLNTILTKNKAINTEIDLGKVQKALKYAEIARKIQKFNTENSLQKTVSKIRLEVEMSPIDKIDVKNERNFSEWRRLNFSADEKNMHYDISTYENQNQRLSNLVLKTEATLSKYWQNKRLFHQLKSQQNEKN